MARILASIVEISSLSPIEGADRLELAMMKGKGWKVVVGKGDFEVCDLAVFFEIDSYLPADDERYAFLRERCLRRFVSKGGNVLREGIKIKSIKLRGVVSQGLLMPIGKFPELNPLLTEKCGGDGAVWEFRMDSDGISRIYILSDKLSDSEGKMKVAVIQRASVCRGVPLPQDKVVGADVTSLLHVEHYDEVKEQLQPEMGNPICADAMGKFPSDYIPKTDEERIQNLGDWFETMKGRVWQVTCKHDGTSCTIAWSPTIDPEFPSIVCSRNLRLKEVQADGKIPIYWQMANKYNVIKHLWTLADHTHKEYAIQGEIVGPGINGDKNKEQAYKFLVFRIWNITDQKWLNPTDTVWMSASLGLEHVQIVENRFAFFDEITTMEEALKFAEGKTAEGNEREGIVCKTVDDGPYASFKIVSNRYLLKQED